MNETLDSFRERIKVEKLTGVVGWLFFKCFCGASHATVVNTTNFVSSCGQKFIIKKEDSNFWAYKDE